MKETQKCFGLVFVLLLILARSTNSLMNLETALQSFLGIIRNHGVQSALQETNKVLDFAGSIETKEIDFSTEVYDVHWCGKNTSTVLIHTVHQRVHIWVNGSSDWQTFDEIYRENGFDYLNDKIVSVIQNPYFDQMFVFLTHLGQMWITTDCANNFRQFSPGMKLNKIKFSPLAYNWMLASSTNNCSKFKINKNCFEFEKLFMTKDLAHWVYVANYVSDFDWLYNPTNLHGVLINPDSFLFMKQFKRSKQD